MIVTKLIGGLGNQIFQYAAGRRAAFINNTQLKLDITGYEKQEGITPREYMLHDFNIQENFPEIYQLIIPSWGTGFSGENLQNQMSFQIGLANLTVVFLCAFIFISGFNSEKEV